MHVCSPFPLDVHGPRSLSRLRLARAVVARATKANLLMKVESFIVFLARDSVGSSMAWSVGCTKIYELRSSGTKAFIHILLCRIFVVKKPSRLLFLCTVTSSRVLSQTNGWSNMFRT
jgi:hypothetical protein